MENPQNGTTARNNTSKYQTRWKEHSKVKIIRDTGKKHIALIAGGMSAQREMSLESSKDVCVALIELGYKITYVDMGADIAVKLQEIKPDLVFNCLQGTYGHACLPGLLNIMRIPYTHSGVLSSGLAHNKIHCKSWFLMNNINTAESIVVNKRDNIQDDPMSRPYVIKPVAQGTSIGVQVIFDEDNFNFADYDFSYVDQVVVERYIKGREMHVAILNGKALGVLEIKLLKNRFFDFESKTNAGFAEILCPAPIPANLNEKLLKETEKMYRVLGLKGPARAVFMLEDHTNKIYALEINTHPNLEAVCLVSALAKRTGIDYNNLIEEIIKTASFET